MTDLKELAAKTALNNMFRKGHFNICAIDDVAKLLDVDPKGEAYTILRTLHCVDYSTMPKELRDAIPDLVRQCLGREVTFQFANLDKKVVDITPSPSASPSQRLLKAIGF